MKISLIKSIFLRKGSEGSYLKFFDSWATELQNEFLGSQIILLQYLTEKSYFYITENYLYIQKNELTKEINIDNIKKASLKIESLKNELWDIEIETNEGIYVLGVEKKEPFNGLIAVLSYIVRKNITSS